MKSKKLVIAIFVVLLAASPLISLAFSASLPFAGLVTAVVPCTCSAGVWILFTPFYPGGGILLPTAALTFDPAPLGPSIPYADLLVGVVGKLHEGDYFPTPGTCWIYVAVGCAVLPDLGVIWKVGTNH